MCFVYFSYIHIYIYIKLTSRTRGLIKSLSGLEDIEKATEKVLANLQALKDFRQAWYERLGLPANGLEARRGAVAEVPLCEDGARGGSR